MISRQAVLFLLALLTVSLAASPPAREAPGGRKPQLPLTDEGEFVVEPNPTYTHAYNWRDYVAVGSDGAYFLVAWYDGRRDERELYAARVSRTGTLLDPGGLLLATGVDEAPPAIGFDGVNYLVVWSDDDACDIHGARIACTGAVLDPGGFAISSAPRSQRTPRLAFDGANYLVAWADERNWQYHYEIFCARVAPSGAVLDPDGIPVSTSDAWRDMGGLVFNGSDFVVVWTQSRAGTGQDVLASRVSVSGVVLDPEAIVVSSALRDQRGARVASSGGISFVVWEDQRNYRTEVFGARVSQSGAVLDTGGSNYSVGLSAGEPAVSSDRTNFMLVWLDGRGSESVYGSRITQAGAMLDSGGFEIAHDANAGTAPALACGGSNYLVSWVHLYANDDVCCARVSTLGFVLDPEGILVSTAAPTQTMPAASSDGTDYLAVWRDERDDSDIYGVRLDPDGRMLDPRAFPVSEAEGRQLDPALAFNGIEFLAVWQDMRCDSASDVYGARITRDGTVLDPGGIPISTAPNWQYYVAVASDGLDFLAVWHDERPGSAGICGARVTSDGAVLDPEGILVSSRTSSPILPAVAFDGTEFLVVWEEGPSGARDIYGARVTQSGAVLDSVGIAISNASGNQRQPAVVFDGTAFVVVWEDGRQSTHYPDIYAARVSPGGAVLDSAGIVICAATQAQGAATVAFDGTSSVVVWHDKRNGGQVDLYGARLSPEGTVSDSGPVVVGVGDQLSPALTRGAGSSLLLAYQDWTGVVNGKTYNSSRIWGKIGPFLGVHEVAGRGLPTEVALPSVVRNVLYMPAERGCISGVLLDVAGRKAMSLNPGENDVSSLAPGVYFCQLVTGNKLPTAGGTPAKTVMTRKLVIAR